MTTTAQLISALAALVTAATSLVSAWRTRHREACARRTQHRRIR